MRSHITRGQGESLEVVTFRHLLKVSLERAWRNVPYQMHTPIGSDGVSSACMWNGTLNQHPNLSSWLSPLDSFPYSDCHHCSHGLPHPSLLASFPVLHSLAFSFGSLVSPSHASPQGLTFLRNPPLFSPSCKLGSSHPCIPSTQSGELMLFLFEEICGCHF